MGEFEAEFAPLPHRFDIIGCAQKRAERDAREHVMAEELRPLAKIGLVQRIGFGQHNQAIGVDIIDERRKLHVGESGTESRSWKWRMTPIRSPSRRLVRAAR